MALSVDHLCYTYRGGAGSAAVRLHDSLRRRGVQSRFWQSPQEDCPPQRDIRPLPQTPAWRLCLQPAAWLPLAARCWRYHRSKRRHLSGRPAGFEIFSPARLRRSTPFPHTSLTGDVLVVHWLGKLLDYPSFFATFPADRPIVWVLHDMHPLTGGCHFAGSCHEFERACGGCPQLRNPGADDLSAETLALKASLLERLTVHVVAPSRWLTEQARRSRVMRGARSLRTIAYGLDTAVLRPLERRGAKLRLGIDPQRKVVCFGADSCANPRKGAAQLAAAWRQLGAERPLLLAFGGGQLPEALRGSELRELGYLRTAEEKAAAYSAADVFVLPSLEDNLPQTGLEAMACGTPVVAFAAGGVPDFVRHERTGLLAPTGDVAALASALTRMLEDAALRRACGRAARETVEREYAADVEAETYERLFIEAVGDQRRSAA